MFVDRERELEFLDHLLQRKRPGPAQLVLLYGRRRVGKSRLLLRWAERSALPYSYWAAEKEGAGQQRRKLYGQLFGTSVEQAPVFGSWAELWEAAAVRLRERRQILILDELPYAAESDSAMLSALQHAWDGKLKRSGAILALCGSHVRTMESLLYRQSPLFGRLTGQWHLDPLPFRCLKTFFPGWSLADRVTAWAIVGGVPAYLEWLDPDCSIVDNLRRVVLSPGSMFLAEPMFLLYDEVRDPRNSLAVLKAIGAGHQTLDEIARASLIDKAHLSSYLSRLQELYLVERRLPATQSRDQRRRSRQGRYHLRGAYWRFFFRFLAPSSGTPAFTPSALYDTVRRELDAFVGATAFEDLARDWLASQAASRTLPFAPEQIGSHWSRRVQADVVATRAASRDVLIGECKWTTAKVGLQAVRRFLDETVPLVLQDLPGQGQGWRVHYAYFARSGFTRAAADLLRRRDALRVDLKTLSRGLATAS